MAYRSWDLKYSFHGLLYKIINEKERWHKGHGTLNTVFMDFLLAQ